jgi:methionyl-tRNA formyltransferase
MTGNGLVPGQISKLVDPQPLVTSVENIVTSAGGADIEPAGLLTNPDSPRGRSGAPVPTEAAAAAEQLNAALAGAGKPPFPVFKPAKLDAELRAQIAALRPDPLVCFAYGRIFGPHFLALFPLGGINIHPSLLPKYRGPTPIPAAILAGDSETGISVQRLAAEMDSGDILTQERIPLNGRETTASLSEIAAEKAAELLPAVLRGIASGSISARPQNHDEASYCSLISTEDGRIDWNKGAVEIDARIRAFDPWPLCRTTQGGRRLFILKAEALTGDSGELPVDTDARAAGLVVGIDKQRGILVQTGEGLLAVRELQYSGKKALYWKDFLNGARNFLSTRLEETNG